MRRSRRRKQREDAERCLVLLEEGAFLDKEVILSKDEVHCSIDFNSVYRWYLG
jgi:hypothetical protein